MQCFAQPFWCRELRRFVQSPLRCCELTSTCPLHHAASADAQHADCPHAGRVSFRMQLTTPACPIKDEFERKAHAYVETLEWVRQVDVTMDAQPPRPLVADDRPPGLQKVAHVIAVSSCKGGAWPWVLYQCHGLCGKAEQGSLASTSSNKSLCQRQAPAHMHAAAWQRIMPVEVACIPQLRPTGQLGCSRWLMSLLCPAASMVRQGRRFSAESCHLRRSKPADAGSRAG